jgi:hypothetical protein
LIAAQTERADGEIGNVMVVHDVEVQQIGACGRHRAHFVAEAREVADRSEGAIRYWGIGL